MAKKIAVIDDTTVLAESIADSLYMEGFEVSIFSNAVQALPEVEKVPPDLIITDMIMPQMDGLQFVRHLRALEPPLHIPIIVITADTDKDNEIKARKAGAELLLHKPFDFEQLITAINNLLR